MSAHGRPLRHTALVFLISLTFVCLSGAQSTANQSVLIQINKPYDEAVATIQAHGGRVTHQFKYIDAIAADIPADAMAVVRNLAGNHQITKDDDIVLPTAMPQGYDHAFPGHKTGSISTAD